MRAISGFSLLRDQVSVCWAVEVWCCRLRRGGRMFLAAQPAEAPKL